MDLGQVTSHTALSLTALAKSTIVQGFDHVLLDPPNLGIDLHLFGGI